MRIKELDKYCLDILTLIKESSFNDMTKSEVLKKVHLNHPQQLYDRLEKLIEAWHISEDYEFISFPNDKIVSLPFYWWAQCWHNGTKIFEDYPRKKIKIDIEKNNLKINKMNKFFITRAVWKSMLPEIKQGDDLLIRYWNSYTESDKVLLVHNEKPKIKKIQRRKNDYYLTSSNPIYPEIKLDKLDDIQIIGVVEKKIVI